MSKVEQLTADLKAKQAPNEASQMLAINDNQAAAIEAKKTELSVLKKSIFEELNNPKTLKTITQIMPPNMNANKLMAMMFNELSRKPELVYCDKTSLIGALKNCAELGLMPGGILGHAHIVPFNDKRTGGSRAQLFIDYKGLIQLLYNTGKVFYIEAQAVDANDEFSYCYGLNSNLIHTPSANPSGKRVYFYVIVHLKNGAKPFKVMSMPEIEYYRKLSQNPDSSFWLNFYDNMALKTVLKRLAPWLPTTFELSQAVQLDDVAEFSGEQPINNQNAILDGEFKQI